MPTVPELLKPLTASELPQDQPAVVSPPSFLADSIRQTTERQRGAVVSTLEAVRGVNPAQFAKATALERASGIDADVLYRHSDQMEKLLQGNKYADLYSSYQRTAAALTDGRTAALAQNDIDNLTRIERAEKASQFNQQGWAERNLFNPIERWWEARAQRSAFGQAVLNDDQIGKFDAIDAAEAAGQVAFPTRGERENLGAYGLQYLRGTTADRELMRSQLVGGLDISVDKTVQREKNLGEFLSDPGADRAAALGGGLAGTAQAIIEQPGYLGRTILESAPNTLEMLGGGVVGGLGGAAAAGFNAEKGFKRIDVLREAGVDFTSAKSVMAALMDDDLMDEADRRASLKAAGTTLVDTMSMGLASKLLVPASIAGRALSPIQKEVANLAVQVPVQGVSEGAGEALGQYFADGTVDMGDVLLETLSGAAMSGGEVAVFGGKRMFGNFREGLASARVAKRGQETLAEMVDAAKSSELRGLDAQTFASVATQQLAGSPMEMLSIPVEALNKMNQSGIAPLAQILESVPGLTEQFAEAEALGGSLQIKTSDYLTYFAEYHDQLAGSVRVQIDGMSTDEAAAWQSEQEQAITDFAESLLREPDARDLAYVGMIGELQQAGYRRADAEQYAATHIAAMSTLAERTGKPLTELLERFPLDVKANAPEAIKRIAVDDMRLAIQRLRAGDIPRSSDMFGKSLIEYLRDAGGVRDDGGEFSALDIDVGRVGRNRITRSNGKSADDLALQAWERGYFPGVAAEDIGPSMLVDAVRNELLGRPTYSVEQENPTLRDQAANLEQLEQYLGQLGVDIAELTDDEVLAILRDPTSLDGRNLEQAQAIDDLPDLPARADGESSRVGAGGLVVVHGTGNENLTVGDIEIVRSSGQKQGKRGRVYGGFYATSEQDAAQAEGYANAEAGTASLFDVTVKPGTGILNKTGDITRLSETYINELVGQGYGLIVGVDPRGRTEYVIIDQSAIQGMGRRGDKAEQRTLNQSVDGDEKNLFVAHNLSAENLLSANELGGLAAPSIAVGRSDVGFGDFGEITLLADPSLLNDKKIRTFDADVYSPRQPRAQYDIDQKAFGAFVDGLDPENLGLPKPDIDTAEGSDGANALLRSDAVRLKFLSEQGKAPKLKAAKVEPEVKQAAKLGANRYELADDPKFKEIAAKRYKQMLVQVQEADSKRGERYESIWFEEDGSVKRESLREFAGLVNRFRESGGKDIGQLRADIAAKFRSDKTAKEYEQWVAGQFNQMVKGKRLFGGFTNSGNRRYTPYNMENVVKAMTQALQGGEGFFYGAGSARSAYATELRNLQDIRSRRGNIVSPAEMEEVKKQSSAVFEDALEKLKPHYRFDANGWGYASDAGAAITEGPKGIREAFDSSPEAKKIISDLTSYLRDLPTAYFEAKAQRAVGISEFNTAVVPKGIRADALQALRDAGLKIKTYDPKVGGSRNAAIAQQKQLLFQGGDNAQPRGSITLTPGQGPNAGRTFQISLSAKRDLSTLLHEFGHYYLEVIADLAQDADATQQIRDDVAIIRQWSGAKETGAFETEQHEMFARGFESYLAEGNAPNPELAAAFARFKRWLIAIYKDLRRLNVELNDDIRAVMDRIVATDEQINEAQQVTSAMPLFETAAKAGMTDAEFAAYRQTIELAHAEAATTIEQQIIRDEERKRSKWWNDEERKVRAEVAEELDTMPEYAAIKALRTGVMPDGSTQTIKLRSSEIRERYGMPVLQKLAFMHAKKGGLPMDTAAMVLGYSSGDEMIKAILGAAPRADLLKRETEQRMLDRHGASSSGESAERAMDAVHNEKRAAVLIRELAALGKQGNRKNITSQQVLKQAAERVMQQRKVREIQPYEYQRAEGKAGRMAFEAASKGDLEAAYQHKQQQLLNFYMWREATKARKAIDSITGRMAVYNKTAKRAKLGKAGHDYLDQIDAVMEQYEFRDVSLRELDKRVSFARWYQDQLALGNEPMVPEFVLSNSRRTNYKDLSLEQLTELDEFVANIDHLSKLKNKLLANSRMKDFEETKNALVAAAYDNLAKKKAPPIDKATMSILENADDWLNDMGSALLKMEQIVEWLDGGDVTGPWSTAFWQPFVEAQIQKDDLNRQFTERLMRMVDAYTKQRGASAMTAQTYIKGIGQPLTQNAIISAALNTGNKSNRDKLLKGYGWSEQQLQEILGNMTAEDWAFTQQLWDLVETLWPEIERLEKDLHGIAPAKVEHQTVVTQFGEYRGGYWPLVYDTSAASYAGVASSLTDGTGLFEQGYAKATTPKGHTKARVDSFAAPILLDTGIVASHLGQVIHDLTHRRAIRDAAKIIGNREIKQALNDTLGFRVADQFNPWLQGVANDMVMDSQKGIDAWTRLSGQLRANLSVAWMGFSATTGIQQILGISQSFEYMSQKGGRRYLLQGMQEFVTSPFKTIRFVRGLSGEMRNRDGNLDNNMREVLKRISGKTSGLAMIQRLAFRHIGLIQSFVDYPTWMAGYHQAMANGMDADQAISAGDRAVRLSQMAAGPKDLAAVQRKDGLMKALTIVYSYFSLLYNRQTDLKRSLQTAKGMADYLQAFERTMFLIVLPAVLAPLMTGNGPGDDEEWSKWIALKAITYPLMAVPLVRDVASALESGWGYRGATPLGSVGETLTRLAGAATADEPDAERLTLLAMDAAGYTFGLPAAQPKRTVKYLFDVAEGEVEDDGIAEFVRGVLFGPERK